MAKNGLKSSVVAKQSGLHTNTIIGYMHGDYEPKMSNLIAVVTVIANAENRSPTQVLFESIVSMPEIRYAEARWKKQNNPIRR